MSTLSSVGNPHVNIGNVIPEPGDPQVVRKTFSKLVFDQQRFFVYGVGEDGDHFEPGDMGDEFFMFYRLDTQLGGTKPDFVAASNWEAVKESASGFVTAVHSVMPKIIVPSTVLVENGIKTDKQVFEAWDESWEHDFFNWVIDGFNGGGAPGSDWFKLASVGGVFGSLFPTFRAKADGSDGEAVLEIHLDEPTSPLTGPWEMPLVGTGAMMFMLNVVAETKGGTSSTDNSDNPWSVELTFGEITLNVSEGGALAAKINSDEQNWVHGNLAEGKTKQGPPQQKHISEGSPYVFMVYPCWNGIIVASGVQDGRSVVYSSSTYVPKIKGASIFTKLYSDGFDPTDPGPVEVGTDDGATNVDFGDGTDPDKSVHMTIKNCRCELAYVPCFFSYSMKFDNWFVENDDSTEAGIAYKYTLYPIWTSNDTDYDLDLSLNEPKKGDGPIDNTSYAYGSWELAAGSEFKRRSGEIFGAILGVNETRDFPIKNGNGTFNLIATPNNPGNPDDTKWQDYITNVNINISTTGSSGTITVDKYGVHGTGAVVTQSIGAITVFDATGGKTTSGSLFAGLAMGVGESAGSDGATWTIPLIGLEKKLDDIALINVPFFDGHTLGEAISFLSRYAGIQYDASLANSGLHLSVSEDVNVARFDWKSGTSVRSALDDVMKDTLHTYSVHDGIIYFYELGNNGLPKVLGPDYSGSYTNLNITSKDQTPDFDDLRNEIVVIGVQQVQAGMGAQISDIPHYPRIEVVSNATTPDVPWAKSLVYATSGALDPTKIHTIATRLAARSSIYLVMGHLTIPGDARIRPFDKWGEYVIINVTHNIDMRSKTWTTDLEFSRPTK